MSIDAAAFKKGMRHLAASVTLITTRHRQQRGGLTATAVCSVSAEPPQLLVCVNKTASAHDPIGHAGFFCVNILSPQHRKIAERFAGRKVPVRSEVAEAGREQPQAAAAAGPRKPADLKAAVLADPAVQALFDRLPSEIRGIEELPDEKP